MSPMATMPALIVVRVHVIILVHILGKKHS